MTSNPGQSIRSFIAIELPQEVREALSGAQASLRPLTRDVRWVAPEGIHLTLEFLKMQTGVDIVYVAYRGAVQSTMAVASRGRLTRPTVRRAAVRRG